MRILFAKRPEYAFLKADKVVDSVSRMLINYQLLGLYMRSMVVLKEPENKSKFIAWNMYRWRSLGMYCNSVPGQKWLPVEFELLVRIVQDF